MIRRPPRSTPFPTRRSSDLLKTKIYAYVDTLLSKRDEDFAKEDKRDYLNTDHWNLSHDYLNPLESFLESYL